MSDCIFCKIVAGTIPSRKVYEDEHLLAFHDIQPAAPVHFLIIPKAHVATLEDCTEAQHAAILGRILLAAPGWRESRVCPMGSGRLSIRARGAVRWCSTCTPMYWGAAVFCRSATPDTTHTPDSGEGDLKWDRSVSAIG